MKFNSRALEVEVTKYPGTAHPSYQVRTPFIDALSKDNRQSKDLLLSTEDFEKVAAFLQGFFAGVGAPKEEEPLEELS